MPDLLIAEHVTKRFRWRDPDRPWRHRWVTAVDDVSLRVPEGRCTALVGESGSGKSTLARCLLRLIEPDSGAVEVDGEDLATLDAKALRHQRRIMQIVLQDAAAALDPRLRVGDQVAEGLRVHQLGAHRDLPARVASVFERVGLDPMHVDRFPHQLSGGQRQRVCIARSLACRPRLLVLDEPVSALDVSVQARILALLADLRRREGLTLLFISHDLAVVDQIADHVVVLYAGRVVEAGRWRSVVARPRHPYTAALIDAVRTDGDGADGSDIAGDVPSPLNPPSGCAFHPRCPRVDETCRRIVPPSVPTPDFEGHSRTVACHHPLDTEPRRGREG